MNKKGFTLVELLSVVIILSILIVVVATNGFGLFNKAKEKINEQEINNIKESISILLTEIDHCEDDTKDYETLKKYFNNIGTVNSCDSLKSTLKSTVSRVVLLNMEELLEDKYIDDKIYNSIGTIILPFDSIDNDVLNLHIIEKKILEYENVEKIKECSSDFPDDVYGDINFDGDINVSDAVMIQNFAKASNELSDIQKVLVDVNNDKEITLEDAVVLQRYLLMPEIFPIDKYYDKESIKEYMYGDINVDGNVDDEDLDKLTDYLKKYINPLQQILSDVDNDGSITEYDGVLLFRYSMNINECDICEKIYAIDNTFGCGDINGDENFDENDIIMLEDYLNNKDTYKFYLLSLNQQRRADINGDGKVDISDLYILNEYLDKQK
ncbi:MAG: prepilin-type N-terminal cleavage/methylation domain-containing protein [Bacilli bacterium]|nr:prepilin-type N-terminal cleavage/methylation domain-containing protein [Bacilli bacterium]